MWLVVLWTLIALIFLVKIPDVRNLYTRWRQMPLALMVTCAFGALYLGTYSYSKSGTNMQRSASSAGSISQPSRLNPESRTLSMPAWWVHDETDTDGDGIPDLWEKWTHGNPLVADSDLDRDDDGLTDLEEFWNQTDPRTADTDGDGFSDEVEVTHGMNPLVAEEFTPTEPDLNNNGIIDIWEHSGYIYGFEDLDGDGFDDTYAWNIPNVSDANFDIVVEVYTTRSTVLTWGNVEGSGGIVILPTTGTFVRLRLPFGADTELKLLPAPEGTDPPSEELWKSRIHVRFDGRAGQTLSGNALVSPSGVIAHKVVNMESVIKRFPLASRNGGFQPQTLRGGDSDGPNAALKAGKFEVFHTDEYHGVGDAVGPFNIINTVGLETATYHWYSQYGDMSPTTGLESWLTLQKLPTRPLEKVTVVTTAQLDTQTQIAVTSIVEECSPRVFAASFSTQNYSPHLGETLSIGVTVPGCMHYTEPGWLEAEVMRETTAGWQHVCWMDASQAQPGHQKRRLCHASPQTIVWNGIATESAAQVESPDVFTDAVSPFHRVLPKVISGEPVPPPYYTIFIRYREENNDSAPIIAEVSTKLYVPQVVKIEMTDAAYAEFCRPVIYPESDWPSIVGTTDLIYTGDPVFYDGCTTMTILQVLDNIVEKCQRHVPSDVNLRFTRCPVNGRCKYAKMVLVEDIRRDVCDALGFAPIEHCSWRNDDPYGVCYVYTKRVRIQPCIQKLFAEVGSFSTQNYDPALIPFTPIDLTTALASVTIHETGHTLGLVNPVLYGNSNKHNQSNAYSSTAWIMNKKSESFMQLFGKSLKPQAWKPRNRQYLRFVLPKN